MTTDQTKILYENITFPFIGIEQNIIEKEFSVNKY